MKKAIFFIFVIAILSACNQQDAKEELITLKEVENAITEQGLLLEEANLPTENAFIQELNRVAPKAYFIDGGGGGGLSIYVFSSIAEREKGMSEFEEKNATAELVEHTTYMNKNILVFYEHGDEDTNSKLNIAIKNL